MTRKWTARLLRDIADRLRRGAAFVALCCVYLVSILFLLAVEGLVDLYECYRDAARDLLSLVARGARRTVGWPAVRSRRSGRHARPRRRDR